MGSTQNEDNACAQRWTTGVTYPLMIQFSTYLTSHMCPRSSGDCHKQCPPHSHHSAEVAATASGLSPVSSSIWIHCPRWGSVPEDRGATAHHTGRRLSLSSEPEPLLFGAHQTLHVLKIWVPQKTSQKTFPVPLTCRIPASAGRGLSHRDTVDLLFDLGEEGGGR